MNNLLILHLEQGASLGWGCVVHPGSMLHILAASSTVPSWEVEGRMDVPCYPYGVQSAP